MARRHSPEQVIAKVRLGQKMLNDGSAMVEVVKELEITEATWYRWLNQYGSERNAQDTKRAKELEKENARLKRLLAEKELAIDILNEVARGKFEAPSDAAALLAWRSIPLGHLSGSRARCWGKTGLLIGRRNPQCPSTRYGCVKTYVASLVTIQRGGGVKLAGICSSSPSGPGQL